MSATPELLEMRFKRFLHYGSELPIYRTGCRRIDTVYTRDNIPSLLKLMHEEEPKKIIQMIVKVKKEETSAWPDSIIFALAVCAGQDAPTALRAAAYHELRTICVNGRDILLFVKFYRDLMGKQVGGSGFKKAVSQWYMKWMPFDLADMFLHQRSYFNWKHIDVLRVAHVKPVSIVLIAYNVIASTDVVVEAMCGTAEKLKENDYCVILAGTNSFKMEMANQQPFEKQIVACLKRSL